MTSDAATPAAGHRGLSLVCTGGNVHEVAAMAADAERAGFESVWAAEFYDRSAVVAVAAMAAVTESITLGTGIAYGFGRTPLVLAAEARDLDALCGGRLILGLGTGTRRMQQDWHGLSGEHPAARAEELVPLLRRLWRLDEGPVRHEGRFYRAHVVPTAPVAAPTRPAVPVYLAGVNTRMIRAAGAVADGLVGHPLFTPEYLRHTVRPALAAGAERAGPVPVAGYVICAVDPDEDRARRMAAAQIAFYASVKTYDSILTLHGFTDEAGAIQAARRAGDLEAMVAAVSDRMIDTIAVAGTPEQVRSQFAARWAGLYERTLLYPSSFAGPSATTAVLDAFAPLTRTPTT
ncbi:LLM class flavin-dependent oxidoreductase [Amycolatopsis sp. K13G38]|uniref:LLM class flavin-dependent oxidoreductase n=1 Tax=Amycolatopsis acididurans TaxID=2724524 RepID=A0ABX1JKQ5_9PSEU|nr:LLM class flavin-dependent oxidoreductase [Amycolatopsis acididurans]NKQ59409.1 LLM class flavin-dependent oxidoreductase [Amycolatopsis acididurans]